MQNHSDIILNKAILLILLVIILNVIILITKISIYLMTMSIAAFTYLFDTIMDLQNDFISLFGLKKARVPPDKDHPYGHAKYDAFVATIIAVFIIAITIEMAIETFTRIFEGIYQVNFDPSLIIIFFLTHINVLLYCNCSKSICEEIWNPNYGVYSIALYNRSFIHIISIHRNFSSIYESLVGRLLGFDSYYLGNPWKSNFNN